MRPIQLKGHERSITHLKYNKEGDLLFTCSKANFPCIWYSDSGERIGTYNGHNGAVWSLDVTQDSSVLVTGSADMSVKIWDVETGRELCNLPHKAPVRCVEFAEGDRQFLTVTDQVMGNPPTILIYTLSSDRSKPAGPPVEIVVPTRISQAMFGPLNKTIITCGEDGIIRTYDSESRKLINENKEHTKQVNRMSFDKNRILFITASKDGTAKLIDAKTLKVLKTYDTGRPVNAASVSPLKDHVILGGGQSAESVTTTRVDSSQFKVRFFHKIFTEELGSIPGHFGPVNTLSFSPDGYSFASGGEDGFVRIHHFDPSYFTSDDR
jgi:translation initiation factor 3 subunit I